MSRSQSQCHLVIPFLVLCASVAVAAPEAVPDAAGITLRNALLSARFERAHGGWLEQLTDPAGHVYVAGGQLYSDWGLLEPRGLVGTPHENAPQLSSETGPDGVSVVADGWFKPAPGAAQPGDALAYRLRWTLADQGELALRLTLTPHRDLTPKTAFLACLWSLPEVSEWLAWTVDGRCNALVANEGRVYQSAELPLDPARREFGVVYRDGRQLTVRGLRGPLANGFLHAGGGGAALFLAVLDGEAPAWKAGEAWELSCRLCIQPSAR